MATCSQCHQPIRKAGVYLVCGCGRTLNIFLPLDAPQAEEQYPEALGDTVAYGDYGATQSYLTQRAKS